MLTAAYVASPLARTGAATMPGMVGSVLAFFEPVQPVLALLSIGLLTWALVRRISQENACKAPAAAS